MAFLASIWSTESTNIGPQVDADQLGEALSLMVELDPCNSHQDVFGQLITKKVQNRRYFTTLIISHNFLFLS